MVIFGHSLLKNNFTYLAIIGIFLNKNNFQRLVIILIVVAPIVRFVVFQIVFYLTNDILKAGESVNLLVISQIDSFAFGAAISVFNNKIKHNTKIYVFIGSILISQILINVLCFFVPNENISLKNSMFYLGTLGFPYLMIENFQFVYGYTILNIFFHLILRHFVTNQSSFQFLSNSYLVLIGKISYVVYVYHVIVLVVLKSLLNSSIYTLNEILFFSYLHYCHSRAGISIIRIVRKSIF